MARQARIDYQGALYHVISRGIETRELLRDDADRRKCLVRSFDTDTCTHALGV